MQRPVYPKLLASWEEFRDWYYQSVVGRAWNGRSNTSLRRSEQKWEQYIHDGWRQYMGHDAPWTDVMELIDHRIPIGLAELKHAGEQYPDWQRSAHLNLARKSGLRLWLFVGVGSDGPPFEVSLLYDPEDVK